MVLAAIVNALWYFYQQSDAIFIRMFGLLFLLTMVFVGQLLRWSGE